MLFRQRVADHDFGGNPGDWNASRFGDEWNRAAGTRVYFQHIDDRLAFFDFHGELNVHQSDHVQSFCQCNRGGFDFRQHRLWQTVRRQRTGRVPRVYASLFDVLHDSGDHRIGSVRDAVDIDFDRVFQKTVDQNRLTLRDDKGLGDILFELRSVVTDFHSTPAQNKTGANQNREVDF